jgi:hypothetical protein
MCGGVHGGQQRHTWVARGVRHNYDKATTDGAYAFIGILNHKSHKPDYNSFIRIRYTAITHDNAGSGASNSFISHARRLGGVAGCVRSVRVLLRFIAGPLDLEYRRTT